MERKIAGRGKGRECAAEKTGEISIKLIGEVYRTRTLQSNVRFQFFANVSNFRKELLDSLANSLPDFKDDNP